MKDLEDIQGSRVYGRRLAKPLKKTSAARLEKYFSLYSISLEQNETIDVSQLFDHEPKEVWLEIGFGKGEHLIEQAKANPDVGFIGCEPFVNGVSGMVDHMDREGLSNIRFFMNDARLLMDALPDGVISRAFILFPDPWPKKRHHKRRIVSVGNLKVLSRLLKDNAELRIGTDHHDYCRWILARLMENPDFNWKSDHPDDWHNRPDDWPSTRYEKKALKQGRKSSYMTFIRTSRKATK
ncbi:MAG: tRNA (guanosine(46)-N7)-methyltransferase TrmB [Kordiimonadaceae bacterium]|jgi:tRNA (guanine-N7-)-methyltransferase|nr:tRNA (guanosine(46)-N7)-methyltransferase TrmB [Kordiimonadaceae bacterium]MBT6035475.1 tRNA (guanosine(46)-N7)-methyltransferase TrmB [Kordiimonadaceae bacterium]MBT6328171.1 tRNA (guanosine(46)-N7)-methyltransferase TrmB [Kordiimonadaceae bacterium]MBT7581610.1 tRNA (guanosine(46)-N7)-methyltransferase TrmB [Kordiimonadaceae bacterium]